MQPTGPKDIWVLAQPKRHVCACSASTQAGNPSATYALGLPTTQARQAER